MSSNISRQVIAGKYGIEELSPKDIENLQLRKKKAKKVPEDKKPFTFNGIPTY